MFLLTLVKIDGLSSPSRIVYDLMINGVIGSWESGLIWKDPWMVKCDSCQDNSSSNRVNFCWSTTDHMNDNILLHIGPSRCYIRLLILNSTSWQEICHRPYDQPKLSELLRFYVRVYSSLGLHWVKNTSRCKFTNSNTKIKANEKSSNITWKAPLKFKLQSKHIATNKRSCDECPILVAGQLKRIPTIRNCAKNDFWLILKLPFSVN